MQNFKHKTYSPLSFLEKLLCLDWIIVLLHKMFRVALPIFLSHSTVDYYSPRTWPRNCTSAEIKELLKDHLINPTSHPNYESLKQLLDLEDFVGIEILVQQCVKRPPPREVEIPRYLHCHLSKSCDDAAMPLQERTRQLDVLVNVFGCHLGATNNACNNVAFCHSPRGSGKTQFVKCFVSTRHAAAAKHGRVIVRCCGNAAHSPQAPWIKKIMDDCKGCKPNKLRDEAPSPRGVTAFLLSCLVRVLTLCKRSPSSEKSMKASPVAQGLCEMIRAHVELETGNPQDVSKYSTPQTAYETWKRETARFFKILPGTQGVEPLIILDTCEILAEHEHKSLKHQPSDKPYTLLEALCLAVPHPYRIFVIGCNAKVEGALNIGPLLPLSNESFDAAVHESWRTSHELNEVPVYVRRLLYCLTGGLPRLLRLQMPTATTLTQCFGLCRESAQSLFPIAQRSIAYTCLLVSSTKARVKGSDVVAVNPAWRDPADHARTFDDAMSHSIGTHDPVSDRFHVAPITFVDPMCPRDAPILPSQLHPFLKEDIVSRFGMHTAAEGTTLFGRIFLTALYARYLLTSWEDTTTPWVSLAKVLNGAVHPTRVPILERYQVNLSSGVVNATVDATQRRRARAVENAVTYMGRTSEPQCAYIWCRDVGGRGATFAVPLQLRSGGILNARNPSQLLLIVHRLNSEEVANENRFVAINASSMSCIDWLESTTS